MTAPYGRVVLCTAHVRGSPGKRQTVPHNQRLIARMEQCSGPGVEVVHG